MFSNPNIRREATKPLHHFRWPPTKGKNDNILWFSTEMSKLESLKFFLEVYMSNLEVQIKFSFFYNENLEDNFLGLVTPIVDYLPDKLRIICLYFCSKKSFSYNI